MDQNQIRPGACDMGMNIQPLNLNHCANGRHRLFCFAVTQVRKTNNSYVQAAVNILGGYDLQWQKDVPFLWLTLPDGWRAGAFAQAAEVQGVRIRIAEEYACRDARAPHAIRFAINAGVTLDSFESAIGRLRDLLDNPQDQIGV